MAQKTKSYFLALSYTGDEVLIIQVIIIILHNTNSKVTAQMQESCICDRHQERTRVRIEVICQGTKNDREWMIPNRQGFNGPERGSSSHRI